MPPAQKTPPATKKSDSPKAPAESSAARKSAPPGKHGMAGAMPSSGSCSQKLDGCALCGMVYRSSRAETR
ncbi:MAG: hypothetical protein R6U56_06440, partial [Opitutales bacterium]